MWDSYCLRYVEDILSCHSDLWCFAQLSSNIVVVALFYQRDCWNWSRLCIVNPFITDWFGKEEKRKEISNSRAIWKDLHQISHILAHCKILRYIVGGFIESASVNTLPFDTPVIHPLIRQLISWPHHLRLFCCCRILWWVLPVNKPWSVSCVPDIAVVGSSFHPLLDAALLVRLKQYHHMDVFVQDCSNFSVLLQPCT